MRKPISLESPSALRKPMRRGYGWLALMACALFLLGCTAAAHLYQKKAPAPASRPAYAFEQLIPEGAGKPSAVTIAHADETFTLLRGEDGVRLEGEDAALDRHAAGELLACGESILARRRLEGSPEAYGVTAQSLSASFRYDDHSTLTLRLGEAVPTGEGWYAAVDGMDGVYIVNNALARALSISRLSLYALPDLSARFTAQTLKSAAIEQPEKPVITIARALQVNPFNTMVELTSPIHYPANSERAAEVYLALEKLQPASLVAPEGEIADVLATITLQDQSVTKLTIGYTEDGYVMQLDGDRAVYAIAPDALAFLDSLTVPWLAEQLPGLVMLSQVASIDVRAGNQARHFDVDQPAKAYAADGKAIDEADFLPVYQQMIGLLIERYMPDAQPAGDARLELNYTFTDGKRWSLVIAPYDEQFDLIVRGDCACFLLSRSRTDELIRALFAL